MKIYPNSAEDAFTITFENIRDAKLRIIDLVGKVIYQTSTKAESIELSKANGIPTGLYIIQVSDEKGRTTSKKLLMK